MANLLAIPTSPTERQDRETETATAIVVEENPDFDPTQNPVQPSNWRNVATSPDGPVAAETVGHDHGEDAADHDHGDDTAAHDHGT